MFHVHTSRLEVSVQLVIPMIVIDFFIHSLWGLIFVFWVMFQPNFDLKSCPFYSGFNSFRSKLWCLSIFIFSYLPWVFLSESRFFIILFLTHFFYGFICDCLGLHTLFHIHSQLSPFLPPSMIKYILSTLDTQRFALFEQSGNSAVKQITLALQCTLQH